MVMLFFIFGYPFGSSSERLNKQMAHLHPHLLEHMICRLSEQVVMFQQWISFVKALRKEKCKHNQTKCELRGSSSVLKCGVILLLLWIYVCPNRMCTFSFALYSSVRKSGDFRIFIHLDIFQSS